MSKVISVSAWKGGVGKTTSATNIASAIKLIDPEAKIIIIDLDFQSNVALSFGYNPVKLDKTIYQVIHEEISIKDAIKHHKEAGIDLLLSNFDMCAFDIDLFKNESGKFIDKVKPYVLKNILDEIRNDYDYIICDTPPSLSMLSTNYIVASDIILVALQTGKFALEGDVRLIQHIKEMKDYYCKNEKYDIKMFACFVDGRTNISTNILQEARKYCNKHDIYMADNYISKTIRFENAQAYHELPLMLVEESEYTKQYIELTKELILNAW